MKTWWQQYKELELLSGSVSEPQPIRLPWMHPVGGMWRSLVERRVSHLHGNQQTAHLERCWTLGNVPPAPSPWVVLTCLWQDILHHSSSSDEPEVQRVTDGEGRDWWCAYDPRTGQKTYMESEEEVQVWLEERLYFG